MLVNVWLLRGGEVWTLMSAGRRRSGEWRGRCRQSRREEIGWVSWVPRGLRCQDLNAKEITYFYVNCKLFLPRNSLLLPGRPGVPLLRGGRRVFALVGRRADPLEAAKDEAEPAQIAEPTERCDLRQRTLRVS